MGNPRFMNLDDDAEYETVAQSPDDDSDEEYDDEYDDEDDTQEATAKDSDDVTDEGSNDGATEPLNGLQVSWSDPSDDGTIIVQVNGELRTTIREMGDGKAFTSPFFGGQQSTLRKALTAVARNAATRAVSREWEQRNPKTTKPRSASTRSKGVTKDEISDIVAQAVAQALAQQAAMQAAASDQNGADVGGGRPKLKIGRTA